MDSFFSELGIPASDFIQLSTGFLLTMLVFFGVKDKKYQWLKYFLLVLFSLQCLFIIVFHDGLRVKLFATLMLMSALIVGVVINMKRITKQHN